MGRGDSHVLQHKHHLNLADSALLRRVKRARRTGLTGGLPPVALEQLLNAWRKHLLPEGVEDALSTHLDYLTVLAGGWALEDTKGGVRVCPAPYVSHDYLRAALVLPLGSGLWR